MQGEEFTEKFMLGFNNNLTKVFDYLNQISPFEYFLQDNNTLLNKLVLKNLSADPLVMTEGNVIISIMIQIAKIFNYDLGILKYYECTLVIDYTISELNLTKDKDIMVNQDKTLEEYLNQNPNAIQIPFQRNIIRLIGNHMILLSNSFPFPRIQNSFQINPVQFSNKLD